MFFQHGPQFVREVLKKYRVQSSAESPKKFVCLVTLFALRTNLGRWKKLLCVLVLAEIIQNRIEGVSQMLHGVMPLKNLFYHRVKNRSEFLLEIHFSPGNLLYVNLLHSACSCKLCLSFDVRPSNLL